MFYLTQNLYIACWQNKWVLNPIYFLILFRHHFECNTRITLSWIYHPPINFRATGRVSRNDPHFVDNSPILFPAERHKAWILQTLHKRRKKLLCRVHCMRLTLKSLSQMLFQKALKSRQKILSAQFLGHWMSGGSFEDSLLLLELSRRLWCPFSLSPP